MTGDQEGRQRQGLRTDDGATALQFRSHPQPALRGRRSDEEVIGAVQNCLETKPKDFFLTELQNL
jgi:hypothetical protein